jgi:hypothetical protein
MTRNKDQKRIIRTRMKKTGESYTAARAQILSRTKAKAVAKPEPEYSALAGMSDEKVRQATGRTWREWTQVLDAVDASEMKHRDIAQLVHEKYGVREWWTQTVTVGYERIKGLRDRGQRRGGGYESTKSKTFNVPVDVLFHAWASDAIRREWIGGVKATVRKATRPKSVRLQWPDGTIVVAMFMSKGPEKSTVAVTQTKLASRTAAEGAKREWTARFDRLAEVVTGVAV